MIDIVASLCWISACLSTTAACRHMSDHACAVDLCLPVCGHISNHAGAVDLCPSACRHISNHVDGADLC